MKQLVITAMLVVVPASVLAQSASGSPPTSLVDLLVWGADTTGAITGLTTAQRSAVEEYRRRWAAYRSLLPTSSTPEMKMVHAAQVRYERRLVAIGSGPAAERLARAYVAALRPCYEWEGHHDCPEREAQFADAYQATHAGGPFADYLPLLAAHRWLCTAEAYDYEKSNEAAARSRAAYERARDLARRSRRPLVRAAAEALRKRGTCFA